MPISNDNLAREPAIDMTAVAIAILGASLLVGLPATILWLGIVW